jgi:hypothetical protein
MFKKLVPVIALALIAAPAFAADEPAPAATPATHSSSSHKSSHHSSSHKSSSHKSSSHKSSTAPKSDDTAAAK